MRRRLLVAVLALGLAAGLGVLMVRDPGYLGFAYGGWLFESSLWLGLLGLALLAFVLRTLALFVAGLLGFSRGLRGWRARRAAAQAPSLLFELIQTAQAWRRRSGGRPFPRPWLRKRRRRCKPSTPWWRDLGVSPSPMNA